MKLATRIFESNKKAFFQHLFGGALNKHGWLPQYSANVFSSEFYCGTETFQVRYVVQNYTVQRANYQHRGWTAALPLCDSVKIMLFPKPLSRTARRSSPFCRLLTGSLCSGLKTTFLCFDFKKILTLSRLLLRHYFVSLICLYLRNSKLTMIEGKLTNHNSSFAADEVKICDSPPPPPSLCHSPQTDYRALPRWRRGSR